MCVPEVQQGERARSLLSAARNETHATNLARREGKVRHKDAFGELYKRHNVDYRTALRYFAINKMRKMRAKGVSASARDLERFREDSTFSTWLTRIAINEALMLLRQRRTREPLLENAWMPIKDGDLDIADGGPTLKKPLRNRTSGRHCLRQLVNFERT